MKNVSKKLLCLILIICLSLSSSACVNNTRQEPTTNTPNSSLANHDNSIDVSLKNGQEFDKYLTGLFIEEMNSCSKLDLHYFVVSPEKYGINNNNDSFSFIDFDQLYSCKSYENILSNLNQFNYDKLTKEQKICYDILQYLSKTNVENADLALYQSIFNPTTGLQAQMPILLAEYDFREKSDIDEYIHLLKKLPEYYENLLLFEKLKADEGLSMNDDIIDGIILQCNDFAAQKETNYLIETFNARLTPELGLSKEQINDYKQKNTEAVINYVIPSYITLANELTKLKGTCQNAFLGATDNGKEYFSYILKTSVGTSRTPSQLESLISSYQAKCILEISTTLNNDPEISSKLDNPNFPAKEPAEILEYLKANMLKDFPVAPDTTYTINYVHESLEEHLSPAFYLTPPMDDMSSHPVYINNSALNSFTGLFPTLAHEGFPGHLYQNLYFNSVNSFPIRNLLSFTGYSEGWATYVELMSYYYCGFDENTANALFYYNLYNLLVYASLDIGINYNGWTNEMITEKTGISDADTINELRTMISSDPGNYLNYVIGCLEILELKETAKSILKDDFTELKFHKFILDMGEAPFEIIEKYMLMEFK